MVRGRDEGGAEGVHLRERADHTGVAEVIREGTASEARAGRGLDSDDTVVVFAAEFLAHERSDQTAEVGAAAGAADDDVGLDAVLIERGLGLETDDGLVQEHLIQHAAQHIAVAGILDGDFDSLADRAAEGTGGAGELLEDLAADVGGHRRGGSDVGAVGAHDLTAEGFLLIADFDHVYLTVEAEVSAGHRQGSAPLAGSGLCRDALEALLLRVVGLSDRGVQLMAAGGVVAFKLVVDLRGGTERLLEAVGTDQRRGTVHLIEILDLLRDVDVGGGVVQLLLYQLLTEYAREFLGGHRLTGAGVEQRRGLVLHIRAQVVPFLRDILLG